MYHTVTVVIMKVKMGAGMIKKREA